MNIVFTTTTLPRHKNDGQSPFVLEQAIAWKKERPQDGVYILAPADPQAVSDEVVGGVVIHRYHYFFPYFLERLCYPALLPNIIRNPLLFIELPFLFVAQLVTLLRYIHEKNINFIYAHWVVPAALVAFLAHRITKIPFAVHNHSSDARVLLKVPLFGRVLLKNIINNCSHYFVTNSLLQKEALSIVDDIKKIEVMPMGVNSDSEVKSRNLKAKYDFGFIGRLTAKKGVHYFLDALSQLKKPVRIGIAGTGEEFEKLQFEIKQLKLQKDVELLGHLEGKEKWDFIRSCKAMVFPSVDTAGDVEGMPVSVLEALVAGRIVAASRATNIELLPEWNKLKPYIYLLDEPQNSFSCATILERIVAVGRPEQKETEQAVSRIMKHYRWDFLIKKYIQRFVHI